MWANLFNPYACYCIPPISKKAQRLPKGWKELQYLCVDEVWMLVYKNRDDAVKSLKRDFVEGEDYTPFRQNAEPENQQFNPNP